MQINEVIDALLTNRGISTYYCYQDFAIDLIFSNGVKGVPSIIRLQLGSDWILNSQNWWDDFITKFPIDTSKMAFPYKPVRAFAIHLLGQGNIDYVQLNDDNSLEISFFNTYKLIIPSRIIHTDDSPNNEPEFEISWIIYSPEDDAFPNLRIACNAESKMSISGIESLDL